MKKFIFSFVVFALLCYPGMIFAQENEDNLIDLFFQIGLQEYKSAGVDKQLEVAPFIEQGSTLVPFRAIFEELGYEIEWINETKSIIAYSDNTIMELQIGNDIASVNSEERVMAVAPKIINGRTVVPLRFVSESSGANVEWEGGTKSIYITNASNFDTGVILLYDKQSSAKVDNKIHIYNGDNKNMKTISIGKNEVVNWYTFKGKVLLTIFDKSINNNKLVIYKNDELVTLINNYEIQETFEYNDNLLFHGYDRQDKINILYRFDGENFKLVEEDFYVGKHIIVNDKLLINKYDSKRNYSLLVFDKDSDKPWESENLYDGFIIKDSVLYDNILYMSGAFQDGINKPFACYDASNPDFAEFKILHGNINVNLKDIVVYEEDIYYLSNGKLMKITSAGVEEVYFNDLDRTVRYTIKGIKVYNDKLYFGITSVVERVYNERYSKYEFKSIPKEYMPTHSILVTQDVSNVDYILRGVSLAGFTNKGDNLLIHGKRQTGINSYNEYAIYIYNDQNPDSIASAIDVTKIKGILNIDDTLFIKVEDINRINNAKRDTLLIFKDNEITNLASNVEIKSWDSIKQYVVFSGYEKDIKRNKLYSYGSKFNEIAGNFNVNYWKKLSNSIFVNGIDKDKNVYKFFKFDDDNEQSIKDNIEVINMIQAKGNYYLVYAKDNDSKSPTKGKKILYLFNNKTNNITKIKDNISINDMIYIKS